MSEGKGSGSTKDVLAVSLTNFLDSGGIIATSVGLALTAWPLYLGFSHDTFLVSIIGCHTGNAFGAAVGALIITVSSSFELLLVGVILMGLTTGAGVPASWSYISEVSNANGRAYNIGLSQLAWSTELFPAQYRGGVSGIMFFLVRGTIGIWSLVMGGVLNVGTSEGFTTAGVVMCVFLVVSLIVGIVGTPNTRGRELDDIIRERYGEDMGV